MTKAVYKIQILGLRQNYLQTRANLLEMFHLHELPINDNIYFSQNSFFFSVSKLILYMIVWDTWQL